MKLVILISALAVQTGAPAAQQDPRPARTIQPSSSAIPNAMAQNSQCLPIIQQVEDRDMRDRSLELRTLDREPPAYALRAVDRHVAGCREVTFISRNVAPAGTTFTPSR